MTDGPHMQQHAGPGGRGLELVIDPHSPIARRHGDRFVSVPIPLVLNAEASRHRDTLAVHCVNHVPDLGLDRGEQLTIGVFGLEGQVVGFRTVAGTEPAWPQPQATAGTGVDVANSLRPIVEDDRLRQRSQDPTGASATAR